MLPAEHWTWSNIKKRFIDILSYTLHTPFDRVLTPVVAVHNSKSLPLTETAIWFFFPFGRCVKNQKMSPWVHFDGVLFDHCEKRLRVCGLYYILIHTCAKVYLKRGKWFLLR